jgi:hypothetical protein
MKGVSINVRNPTARHNNLFITKLKFTNSPTEKTTAITDILLALVAASSIAYLQRFESAEIWKINIWCWAFAFITLSGVLGAIAHGLELPEARHQRIRQLLNLSLGLAVSIFVIGVAYDLFGIVWAKKLLPWMLVSALGFFLATCLFQGIFFVFIVYEAAALLFACAAYSWLAVTNQLNGALLIATGVLVSIIAAGIQASNNVSVTIVFEFDHNGIFHIVQILGIILLVAGIRFSLL